MGVDKSGRRIRQMFSQIAPRYDLLNHLLSLGVDYWWRRVAVRRALPRGEDPILDVCTGTADLALSYWRAARGTVPVVGVDFSGAMLRLARQKCQRVGASNIHLVQADATALPFGSELFQIVSAAFGLRNMEAPQRALHEMVRVCRPGGRVVILEFSMPQNRLIRSVYRWYFRCLLPRIGEAIAPNPFAAYHYLPASVDLFPPESYWSQQMGAAGLQQVAVEPLTLGIATLYTGKKVR